MGLSNLSHVDPFEDIDSMFEGDAWMKRICPSSILEASTYVLEVGNINNSNNKQKWLDANDLNGATIRNIFKIFD